MRAYRDILKKYLFNADTRRLHADIRRFICDHLRLIRENLRSKCLFKVSIGVCLYIMLFTVMGFAQEEKFFEVKAKKFVYTPHIIKVNKGDSVRIRLVSEDVHHGFFLDGYGVRTSAYPGQEGALQFTANKPGRFSFRCSVTCGEFHPYMVGYLIVGPNSRFYIYVALVVLFGLANLLWVIVSKKKTGNEQR